MIDHSVVEVLSSKMSISGGRLDLENSVLNREHRNIKGSAAKVEDEDVSLGSDLFVESVSDGRCGGLVNDAQNVDARDSASVLRGLTLKIIH